MSVWRADSLEFHEVDEGRWPGLVRLFEARGGPRHCWCMVWRASKAEARLDGAGRKAALEGRVREGEPVGILAYLDGEPVAWCSIAPRESYRPMGAADEPDEREAVWSVVCFYAVRRLRGMGITGRLLRAAVDHAAARGARVVEGYPVGPDSPSYRFMGFTKTFREAGFEEVRTVGRRRHLMRYRIGSRAAPLRPPRRR